MKNAILRQQLPQNDTERIDVHSWCDRVLLRLPHGVLMLANGAQQLWSSIARVANLQCAEELEGTTKVASRSGGTYVTGLTLSSSQALPYALGLPCEVGTHCSPEDE